MSRYKPGRDGWAPPRRSSRVGLCCVAATVVTMLSSCAGGSGTLSSDAPSSTPVNSLSASSTPTEDAQAAAALAAYRAMWQDVVAASRTSDYQSPTLADHASGQALSFITKIIYSHRKAGLVTKGTPSFDPHVADGSQATAGSGVTVLDCADFSNWLNYQAGTDKLQDNTPGGRHSVRAQVQHDRGGWKVAQLSLGDAGSC